jgi:hypothetical protein
MQKVIIKKQGIQTHGAQFETLIEAQSWIDSCVANNSWGLPERPEVALNPTTGLEEPTGVILPAEYTIEITDITAQVAQEKVNAESLAYLASTDWMLLRDLDGGIPMTLEVKTNRAVARAKIIR